MGWLASDFRRGDRSAGPRVAKKEARKDPRVAEEQINEHTGSGLSSDGGSVVRMRRYPEFIEDFCTVPVSTSPVGCRWQLTDAFWKGRIELGSIGLGSSLAFEYKRYPHSKLIGMR
jgi:hypothetical protein